MIPSLVKVERIRAFQPKRVGCGFPEDMSWQEPSDARWMPKRLICKLLAGRRLRDRVLWLGVLEIRESPDFRCSGAFFSSSFAPSRTRANEPEAKPRDRRPKGHRPDFGTPDVESRGRARVRVRAHSAPRAPAGAPFGPCDHSCQEHRSPAEVVHQAATITARYATRSRSPTIDTSTAPPASRPGWPGIALPFPLRFAIHSRNGGFAEESPTRSSRAQRPGRWHRSCYKSVRENDEPYSTRTRSVTRCPNGCPLRQRSPS